MASREESPYVGPRPFERSADDRARFFGRDREVRGIVSLIVSHPLLLVYAQSGAGKTSLFNTAVWEELRRMGVELLPLARVRGDPSDLGAAEIANVYVFSALESLDPEADPHELAGRSLAEHLRLTRADEPGTRVLVFDQFEELFTSELVYELYGNRWQEQQDAFFAQVSDAIADDPTLRVVFLMRKEYLAELERFAPSLPERLQTRFHLEPLDGDEALAAVEGPLRGTNRMFAEHIAETLVDQLLEMRVGRERIRGRFVEPVQLQVVCRSLWQRLPAETAVITETDVQAFGDVDMVLGEFYDGAVRAAASAARVREGRLRAKLEDAFITSIGTRGTVLREDWKRLGPALDELERRHVLHAEQRAGSDWYELTHDRLIDPIRDSNRRVRRRRAQRFAIGAALVAVAAALAAAVALAVTATGDNATDGGPGGGAPVVAATILIASPATNVVINRQIALRITVNAVGTRIAAGGGRATATLTRGPGEFVQGRNSCHYPGRGSSASCLVFLTSTGAGTTVVEASSTIPLSGVLPLTRKTNGSSGNSGRASTSWVLEKVVAKPAMTIVPARQGAAWGRRATFHITLINRGEAPLRRIVVTDIRAPDCERTVPLIRPGRSLPYVCSGPKTTADYTNVATISSAEGVEWTASVDVFLDVRAGIVEAALAGVRQRDRIEYTPDARRMQGVRDRIRLPHVPRYEDTSSFVTWTYWFAGAPDPMGNGYDGDGNTATLSQRGVPTRTPSPGDLAFYGDSTSTTPAAVGVYVGNGRVAIHTNDLGPRLAPARTASTFRFLGYRAYDLGHGFFVCRPGPCPTVRG